MVSEGVPCEPCGRVCCDDDDPGLCSRTQTQFNTFTCFFTRITKPQTETARHDAKLAKKKLLRILFYTIKAPWLLKIEFLRFEWINLTPVQIYIL